eukprot:scaffold51242_cov64-Phaeocystis_antarctica.AAC.2
MPNSSLWEGLNHQLSAPVSRSVVIPFLVVPKANQGAPAKVSESGARRVRPAAETEGWLNGAATGPRRGARSASVALSRAAVGAGGAEALDVGGAPLARGLTGGSEDLWQLQARCRLRSGVRGQRQHTPTQQLRRHSHAPVVALLPAPL